MSKKSPLFRCASRSGCRVSMLAGSISNTMLERSNCSRSSWIAPEKRAKRPRVRLSMWRTLKPTSEWSASMTKVSAVGWTVVIGVWMAVLMTFLRIGLLLYATILD
jgi:hypothetical protein